MEKSLDFAQVFNFLDGLSKNNNKPWFEANRAEYDKARNTFEQFIDGIIDEFRNADGLGALTSKDCISRINRDIRFSKDKSPYKTNMWATIAPGGKKTMRMGYHVALQPQGRSIIAGGMWEPTSQQLAGFRDAINDDAAQFKRVIQAKPFVEYFSSIEGEKLKTVPQGYDKAHPDLELLKLKQIMVVHYFTDDEVLAGNFSARVIGGCKAMRPFLDYLDEIVQSEGESTY